MSSQLFAKTNVLFSKEMICLLSLLVISIVTLTGTIVIFNALKTRNWTPVDGVIILSQIDQSGDGQYFTANINYEYKVNEKTYIGKCIYYGDRFVSIRYNLANKITKNNFKYKKIIVYYNPLNPSKSVLVTGVNKIAFFYITSGFGLLLLFLWIRTLWWLIG